MSVVAAADVRGDRLNQVKAHKSNVVVRERDVAAREAAVVEKEAALAQKDGEIAALRALLASAEETHQAKVREALLRREDELRAMVLRQEADVAQRISRAEPVVWILHDAVVLVTSADAEVFALEQALPRDLRTGELADALVYLDFTPAIEECGVPRAYFALSELCRSIVLATRPVPSRWAHLETRGDLGDTRTLLSIDKARRLLGYEPQHSWRDHR